MLHLAYVRAHRASPTYLDDLKVQVLDGSAEDPVILLCPHLITV